MADQKKRRRLSVPVPKAETGEVVNVLNYRRNPGVWEVATVESVGGGYYAGRFSWHYTVKVDRPVTVTPYGRRKGGPYRLYVGDDKLEPMNV